MWALPRANLTIDAAAHLGAGNKGTSAVGGKVGLTHRFSVTSCGFVMSRARRENFCWAEPRDFSGFVMSGIRLADLKRLDLFHRLGKSGFLGRKIPTCRSDGGMSHGSLNQVNVHGL